MRIGIGSRCEALRRNHLLRGVLLAGLILGAGVCAKAQALPPGYKNDESGFPPSSGCGTTTFQDGIYQPISQVKHSYVLLLIFSNPKNGLAAGQALFHADAPSSSGTSAPPTLSCMPDPDAIDALNRTKPGTQTTSSSRASPMPTWGLVVQGGCPSDCTGPGLQSTQHAVKPIKGKTATVLDRKNNKDPDPLIDLDNSPNWGIMFAGDDDASAPGALVWQIRVKDALHAGRILKYLAAQGLTGYSGYVGHIMIGYKPANDD